MSEGDDWTVDAGDDLIALVTRARSALASGMSEADSGRIWQVLRGGRPRRASRGWLIASVAAAVLMVAGLAVPRRAEVEVEVVKQIAFESEHDGKVVRFEMTVYRKKEKADGKPTL
jgi:hypothetical protein